MIFKSPAMRLSIVLVILTINLLFLANLLGFIPDATKSSLELRKSLSESLALQFSVSAAKGEFQTIQSTLRAVVERNDDIRSAAIRSNDGKDYPFALRHNLIEQIKSINKKFPDYQSFKSASIFDIFGTNELKGADRLQANMMASVLLINNGNSTFTVQELPVEAQFSPVYAILAHDFDDDGDQDIALGGNLYNVKPEVGRYDASYGVFLENQGGLKFAAQKEGKGFKVKGEIRDMVLDGKTVIVARNRDSLALFKF